MQGFDALRLNDQDVLRKILNEPLSQDEDESLKDQNKDEWALNDALNRELELKDLKEMIAFNDLPVEGGRDRLLRIVVDGILYGIPTCPQCKGRGTMKFENLYLCYNRLDWGKCGYRGVSGIAFEDWKVNSNVSSKFLKTWNKPRKERVTTSTGVEKEAIEKYVRSVNEPLKGMRFAIAGHLDISDEQMKQLIIDHGGSYYDVVSHDTDYIITTFEDLIPVLSGKKKETDAEWESICTKIQRGKELKLGFVTEMLVYRLIKEFGFNQEPYLLEGKLPPIAFATLATEEEQTPDNEKKYHETTKVGQVDPKAKCPKGVIYSETKTVDGKQKQEFFDVYMTQSDITTKSNKYYRMQFIDITGNGSRFVMFCKWGRIGTSIGNSTISAQGSFNSTLELWKAKYLDCTGNEWNKRHEFVKNPGRYFPIEIDIESDTDEADNVEEEQIVIPSLLNIKLQEVVNLIFDPKMMQRNMHELDIDIKKMPLGRISQASLKKSYEILKKIEEEIDNPSPSQVLNITSLSNQFYTIIPHDFGNKIPEIIDSKNRLRAKMKIVDTLSNIEIATSLHKQSVTNINPTDINYESLDVELKPLSTYASEYVAIRKCVENGYHPDVLGSKLKLLDVFSVSRKGEKERFEPYTKQKSRMLLWHGSRLCNFVGILSQGLRIAPPEAPASGYMFGKGLYFADLIQKSATYTHPDPVDNIGLLLLCDVFLGDTMEVDKPTYITELPEDKHSLKALAKYQPAPGKVDKVAGGSKFMTGKPESTHIEDVFLDEAEYVVYKEAQVKISYLVKIKFDPLDGKK